MFKKLAKTECRRWKKQSVLALILNINIKIRKKITVDVNFFVYLNAVDYTK